MIEIYRSFLRQSQCRNRLLVPLRGQRRFASFNTKTFQPNPNGPNQQIIRKLQKSERTSLKESILINYLSL